MHINIINVNLIQKVNVISFNSGSELLQDLYNILSIYE